MTYKLIDYEDLKAFSEKLKTKYVTKNDIPKKLSNLQEDTTHRLVTDTEKKNWNDKVSQSQIVNDINATGDNKVWNVDIMKSQLTTKIDTSRIVDSYFGNPPDTILSQKAINAMVDDFNNEFTRIGNNTSDGLLGVLNSIPTKLSQLENDKTFKTESEIQSMIERASSLKKEVVTSLPQTGKDDVIYLVKDPKGKDNNNYLEYLWIGGKWELIGSTQVDLSGYVTQEQALKNEITLRADMTAFTQHVNEQIRNKLDKEKDKAISGVDGTPITDNNTYATPQYANWLISELVVSRLEQFDEVFSKLLDEKLDKTDIQEFTQQELEEAFK